MKYIFNKTIQDVVEKKEDPFVNYLYATEVLSGSGEYQVIDFTPSNSLYSGIIKLVVIGNPFSGDSTTIKPLVIRPNDYYVEKAFSENFDASFNASFKALSQWIGSTSVPSG